MSPPMRQVPKAPNLDHLYTLNGSIQGPYVIGPKQLRKTLEMSTQQRCRELEVARRQHRQLDRQITELDVPRSAACIQEKLNRLKRQKLRLKDSIALLSRRELQSVQSDPVMQLGAGGFGKVLLAHCVSTRKEVAVKVARPEDYSELRAEHEALLKLSRHDGFPRVFYFGRQDLPGISSAAAADDASSTQGAGVRSNSSSSSSTERNGSGSNNNGGGNTSTNSNGANLDTGWSSPEESSRAGKGAGNLVGSTPSPTGPASLLPPVVLVMEVLGPSLDRLLYETTLGTGGLSPATTLSLATQMLARMESLSSCGLVHGDIQPGNFLMGKDGPQQKRTVHLIDFGLSHSIVAAASPAAAGPSGRGMESGAAVAASSAPQTSRSAGRAAALSAASSAEGRRAGRGRVGATAGSLASTSLPPSSPSEVVAEAAAAASSVSPAWKRANKISGTLDFSSSHVLRGGQARRRDDLESLAYCLAYLMQGQLPWSGALAAKALPAGVPPGSENPSDCSGFGMGSCSSSGSGDEAPGDFGWGAMAEAVAAEKDLCIATGRVCSGGRPGSGPATRLVDRMLRHARELQESGRPDYASLRQAAVEALEALGVPEEADVVFDWEAEGVVWSSVDGSLVIEGYG